MTAGRERETLRALSEAAAPGPWTHSDENAGTEYRPGWVVTNDAFHNPPADDDEPWLAVELHTGTEADAAFIAAAVNYVRAALLPSPPATTGAGELAEAFVEAALEEEVSWEVANLNLTVGDIVTVAKWLAPVAAALAAAAPPATDGDAAAV